MHYPVIIRIGGVVREQICAFPDAGIVVDMEHHESVARHMLVPATLLAVLDDVVFFVVAVVADDEGAGLVREWGHLGDGLRPGQFL